jgi:hypothetical protein
MDVRCGSTPGPLCQVSLCTVAPAVPPMARLNPTLRQ